MKGLKLLAITLAIVLLLVGCMLLKPPDKKPGDILNPGEIITGPDGVSIGAPEGALDKPLQLSIESVEDPRAEVPFPEFLENTEPVGNFYQVTSSEEYHTPHRDYLVVGLPVPQGTPTEDLAVAALSPPCITLTYGIEDESSLRWDILSGLYDEDSGLFFTLLPFVAPEPYIYGLIKETWNSAEAQECEVSFDSAYSSQFFDVSCTGGAWRWPWNKCDRPHEQYTEDILDEAYHAFVQNLGFREPLLRQRIVGIDHLVISIDVVYSESYEYQLRHGPFGGKYKPRERIAFTKFHGDPVYPSHLTTIHELFHAIQFSYAQVFEKWSRGEGAWGILEGTAVAAEMSLYTLTRSSGPRSIREPLGLDTALFNNPVTNDQVADDYRTQDFWVYLGKRINPQNPQISFLIPLFEKGPTVSDLNEMLVEEGTFQSLGDAYWQWAKNHSFEKQVTLGKDAYFRPVPYGNPCEWSGHGHLHTVSISPETDGWEDVTRSFSLEPLSSRVYEIIMDPADWDYSAIATVESGSPDIQFKFYDHEMVNCWADHYDNSPRTFTVDEETLTAHVLISNTSMDSSPTTTLRVSLSAVPVVEKISGPTGTVYETTSTFTWTGHAPSGHIVGYQYRKDGGSWIDHGMNTSYTWSGYSKGAHTFEVRAQDNNGAYSEPEVWSFTYVDEDIEITFACPNLEQVIREEIGRPTGPIYSEDIKYLIQLDARGREIESLEGIQHLQFLQRLYLDSIWVDGREHLNYVSDITPLSGLKNLRRLSFGNNSVSDISPLAELTNLEYLGLYNNSVTDISPLAGLTNLEGLYFGNNSVSDILPLAGLTNLESLGFSSNSVSDLSPLAGLTNLELLGFSSNSVSDLSPLAGLVSLFYLSFDSNNVSDLSPLAGLVNLDSLSFDSNNVSDISPLAGLVNLWFLIFRVNSVSDISPLAGLVKLSFFSFKWNEVSDISPLVENLGIGLGDHVGMRYNYLDLTPGSQNMLDIEELIDRGADVDYIPQRRP